MIHIGVSYLKGRYRGWPSNETFFESIRLKNILNLLRVARLKRENETSHFQNVTFAVYSFTSQKETKLRTYCFVHITQLIDKNHVIYFDITSL